MCKTKGCRGEERQAGYCWACVKKNYKERNPERYAFYVLKNNAKRRGKEFTITFDYFKRFAKKHEYMSKKGRTKTGLHIDRKKEHLGYIPGNLQVLENTDNVKKYLAFDRDQKGKPINFKIKKRINIDDTDNPF